MAGVIPFYFNEGKLVLKQSKVFSLRKHGDQYAIVNKAGQIEKKIIYE